MLYNKWWKPPNDMCVPEESGAGAKTNTLDFKNICKYMIYYNQLLHNYIIYNIHILCICIGGVFAVLLVGLIISIMVSMFEFYHYRKKIKQIEQVAGIYLNY